MARISRAQFLGVAHDHLHRPAGCFRQVVTERNIHEGVLAAEITADESYLENYFFWIQTEPCSEVLFVQVRLLGRSTDQNSIRRVDSDNGRVGFEITLVDSLRRKGLLE